MNVFLNVLYTRAELQLMGYFDSIKQFQSFHVRIFSTILPTRHRFSFVFQPSWDLVVRRILFEMSVGLPSSSILEKEIGISSETTFLFSSSRMQSNFQISFTRQNRNRIQKFLKLNLHTTISGTFKDWPLKLPIFSCGPCLTGIARSRTF